MNLLSGIDSVLKLILWHQSREEDGNVGPRGPRKPFHTHQVSRSSLPEHAGDGAVSSLLTVKY